jgi:hypothetical protein
MQGSEAVRAFAEQELGISGSDHPDLSVLEYGLFSVEDARTVATFAGQSPMRGSARLVAIATGRLFHEAQNALLKLFEEPAPGVTLVLIVPTEGILLPTLRSRLQPLPAPEGARPREDAGAAFLAATQAEREKLVAKLLARTKSDKDAEKQAARLEAASLVDGLTRAVYSMRREGKGDAHELNRALSDLSRFAPLMHDRSTPLKLVFEHLLLVLPGGRG